MNMPKYDVYEVYADTTKEELEIINQQQHLDNVAFLIDNPVEFADLELKIKILQQGEQYAMQNNLFSQFQDKLNLMQLVLSQPEFSFLYQNDYNNAKRLNRVINRTVGDFDEIAADEENQILEYCDFGNGMLSIRFLNPELARLFWKNYQLEFVPSLPKELYLDFSTPSPFKPLYNQPQGKEILDKYLANLQNNGFNAERPHSLKVKFIHS